MAAAAAPWDRVAEYTKAAQEKGCDPAAWSAALSAALAAAGEPVPSLELSHVLVSNLCWGSDTPLSWKYLERALAAGLASPVLVLALLSSRILPNRYSRPTSYRLYMELLSRHVLSFASQSNGPSFKKVMVSVDDVLHLSRTFGIQACEPGILVVEFVFCIIWQLLDATLDDEGLQELTPEKKSKWATRPQDMEIDGEGNCDEKKMDFSEKLRKSNNVMAIELVWRFMHHKLFSRLLSLARENM